MEKEKFENIIVPLMKDCRTHIEQTRKNLQVQFKSDLSFVTNLDLELEMKIKQGIAQHFDNINFLGEEYGLENNNARYTFIIDPIDGTEAFVKKARDYSISIGLEDSLKQEMLYGAVYDVAQDILYCNEKRISSSSIQKTNQVIVQGSSNINQIARRLFGVEGIIIKGGSTALKMARAAWGEDKAYVCDSNKIKIWDVAAASAIIGFADEANVNGLVKEYNYRKASECGMIVRRD